MPKIKYYELKKGNFDYKNPRTTVTEDLEPFRLSQNLSYHIFTGIDIKGEELFDFDIFRDEKGDLFRVILENEDEMYFIAKGLVSEEIRDINSFNFSECEYIGRRKDNNINKDRKNFFSARFIPTNKYLEYAIYDNKLETRNEILNSFDLVDNTFLDEIIRSKYWEVSFYEKTDFRIQLDSIGMIVPEKYPIVYRNKETNKLYLFDRGLKPIYKYITGYGVQEQAEEIKDNEEYTTEYYHYDFNPTYLYSKK